MLTDDSVNILLIRFSIFMLWIEICCTCYTSKQRQGHFINYEVLIGFTKSSRHN
jgi:hypothetical protein